MTVAPLEEALTFVDAATAGEVLNVSSRTMIRKAARGELPAIRVGDQWRFPVDDLASALATDPEMAARLAAAFKRACEEER
jgi:excisionase family DNA binding protein